MFELVDGVVHAHEQLDVWLALADCESGNWVAGGHEPGSARWWWGDPSRRQPPWSSGLFDGGLQFWPDSWRWAAGNVLDNPAHAAWQETPWRQIKAATWLQDVQGWQAWPVCSQRLGLR